MGFAPWTILAVAIIAGAWLCFRRTGARGFLFLAVVLVVWPWFVSGTEALRERFTDQVIAGQQPWLFPYSLMRLGGEGWRAWDMTPGEFLTKFNAAKELLLFLLLAIAFLLIARSLKGKFGQRQAP